MPMLIGILPSPCVEKRFRIILANPPRVIDFGSRNEFTYVDGAEDKERHAYLSQNLEWNSLNADSCCKWLLWGYSRNSGENLLDFIHKFELYVPPSAKICL